MDWLIKLLGGHTKKEFEKFRKDQVEISRHLLEIHDPNKKIEPILKAIKNLEYSTKNDYNVEAAIRLVLDEVKKAGADKSQNAKDLIEQLFLTVDDWKEVKKKRESEHYFKTLQCLQDNLSYIKSQSDFTILSEPISKLELSTRSFNGLNRHGINIVGEIAIMSEAGLKNINNIGAGSVSEIVEAMKVVGFPLEAELPDEIKNAIKNYSEASCELKMEMLNLPKDFNRDFKPDHSFVLMGRNGVLQHSNTSDDD